MVILQDYEQLLGLGHLNDGEVLSSTTSTEEPQYHELEPEPPTLLGVKGQPIDPDEPETPLLLDPPHAPIKQPPAGIHLAIMA